MRLGVPKRFHSVVEWRFPKAHRYWDDCGKVITAVEGAFPGLSAVALEQDGFKLAGQSRGITNANFYWDKAAVEQIGGTSDAAVADAAAAFWDVVSDGLAIREVKRLGHRTFSLFETENPRTAQHLVESLSVWEFSEPIAGLGNPISNGVTLRTILPDGVRRLRLNIAAGTMTIKGREYPGVVLDSDFFVEMPQTLTSEELREFVRTNQSMIREHIDPILRRK